MTNATITNISIAKTKDEWGIIRTNVNQKVNIEAYPNEPVSLRSCQLQISNANLNTSNQWDTIDFYSLIKSVALLELRVSV